MNRSLTNSFVQVGLLLAAFAVGTLLSLSIPSPYQASADAADEMSRPAAASLDTAAILESFDKADAIIGVDVDPRRLSYISQIS